MSNSKKAFSLIELLVGLLLSTIVIAVLIYTMKNIYDGEDQALTKSDLERSATLAFAQIMEVGRLAQTCAKLSGGEFECSVDYSTPPRSKPFTQVRFKLVGDELRYQVKDAGGAWRDTITYQDIQEFTVCDDAAMAAPNGCAIEPQALNQQHTANRTAALSPVAPNRFFRFRLAQRIEPEKGANSKTFILQSALYVRNPVPILGPGQVLYQWGRR